MKRGPLQLEIFIGGYYDVKNSFNKFTEKYKNSIRIHDTKEHYNDRNCNMIIYLYYYVLEEE